jgi:hypothetical protein
VCRFAYRPSLSFACEVSEKTSVKTIRKRRGISSDFEQSIKTLMIPKNTIKIRLTIR